MRKLIFAICTLAVIGLSYWLFTKDRSVQNSNEVSLRLNWLTTCSFAGEIVGAERFAQKNGIKIRIDKGGPGLDPLKLVEANTNTFGVAGGDLILSANDKGGDFVIIGLVNYNSPGVWVSKAEKNIKTITDINPKTRIGELPGGNMIYLYEVMLKKTGLERNKSFKPVAIPFELKNFIAGDECDLRPIFNYEVLPELDMLKIKYNVLEPKNLGIDFKGPAYFCKRSTIEQNPELVQGFINTMIEGWAFALSKPSDAISAVKRFDNSINEQKEVLGLNIGKPYFEGYDGKILNSDLASWEKMSTDMKSLGFLKSQPDLNKVIDFSFVENYYKKK